MSASQLLELRKANREKFDDVAFQLECLKERYETISGDGFQNQVEQEVAMKELLKALGVEKGHSSFLPPPGQCSVLLLFDAQRQPHFEFIFRPQPIPASWPTVAPIKSDDLALYSAAIYEKVFVAKQKKEEKEAAVKASSNNRNSNNKRPADDFSLVPFNLLPLPAKRPGASSNGPSLDAIRAAIFGGGGGGGGGGGTPLLREGGSPVSQASTLTIASTTASTSASTSPSISSPSAPASKTSSPSPASSPVASTSTVDPCLAKDAAIGAVFLNSNEYLEANNKDRISCPLCSQVLTKYSMREHITVVHLGQKPYLCKFPGNCTFSTGYRSSIKSHLEKVHNVDIYYEKPETYFEYFEFQFPVPEQK